MTGVSLPFDWLMSGGGLLGSRNEILAALKSNGVESIELRSVCSHSNAYDVLKVASYIWDKGFNITVHSCVTSVEKAVEEVFPPLLPTIKNIRQDKLIIIIHPINGDNAGLLTVLSDYCIKNGIPVCIVMENNRLLPDNTEGDSASLVLKAVQKVNHDNVGICFDMGHYLYYRKKNHPNEAFILPCQDFFKYLKHTNIHALLSRG